MTSNRKYLFVTVALALLLLTAFAVAFQPSAYAAQPQPLYAPTPVSSDHSGIRADVVTFWETVTITEDTASNLQNVADHAEMDLQWVFDQTVVAAAANTTTLTLQFSNDGVNWVDGAAVVSANAADATDLQPQLVFGRYVRLSANVSNALPVTITAIGVAK